MQKVPSTRSNRTLVSMQPRNDDDATKPTFTNVTMEQGQIIVQRDDEDRPRLGRSRGELSRSTLDAVNRANEEDKVQQQSRQSDEQEHLIEEEFKKDPEVIALTEEIAAAEEQRDHARSLARQPNDPARRAAETRYKKLWSEYERTLERPIPRDQQAVEKRCGRCPAQHRKLSTILRLKSRH